MVQRVSATALSCAAILVLCLSHPSAEARFGSPGAGGAEAPDPADEAATESGDHLQPLPHYDPHWPAEGGFAAAEDCARCHRASDDTNADVPAVLRFPAQDDGEDVSPGTQWRHSMMAQSLSDPYFLANVEEEAAHFPAYAGFIEDTCMTCHAPMARTHAHRTGKGLDDEGFLRLDTALHTDMARDGVSCTLCHQIVDDAGLGESAFSGAYPVDPGAARIYGGYTNPRAGSMRRFSGYDAVFGDHMSDSAHCATCHVLYTPVIDADTDEPTGEQFLEQAVYFEWENSVFATGAEQEAQCQDCHMPSPEPETYATRLAVRPGGGVNTGWPERGPWPPYRQHNTLGGNAWVLSLLREGRELLGIADSTSEAGFDRQIGQTRAFLREQTADLELDDAAVTDRTLMLDLRVINRTGHKLPTSYPSRRVWVNLRVRDVEGNLVFDSGTPDEAGRITPDLSALDAACLAPEKPAGFFNGDCLTPHYDVITDADQVAVYEPVLEDTNGNVTYLILNAGSFLKDNRIPPQGFSVEDQHPDTASIGTADDSDFNADGSGSDTVHYRIGLGDAEGPFRVEARLLYQSVRPTFVAAISGHGPHSERFKMLAEETPPMVEELAVLDATVSEE